MNRLKVAIQELRDHLGRDTHGTLLLDKVTAIANSQRTRCASLEEAAAASDAMAKSLRSKVELLESELTAIKGDLIRESAKRTASESRERALLSQIKSQEEPEEDPEESQAQVDKVLALLGRVQRRFKKLPVQKLGTMGGLVVEDFIKLFAYDEFAGLGMVMAACALMNVPLRLIAEHPVYMGESLNEKQQEKFVNWYRNAIDEGPQWKSRLFLDSERAARGLIPQLHSRNAT